MLSDRTQLWIPPTFIYQLQSGESVICKPGEYSEIGKFAPENILENLTMITKKNLQHYRERFRAGNNTHFLMRSF